MATPTIQGTPAPAFTGATGWVLSRQYTSYASGTFTVTKVWRGPYSTLSAAHTGVVAMNPQTITPSASDGSAIASITATFSTDPENHEIRDPTYEIIPVREAIRIEQFPYWRAEHGPKEALEKAIRNGTASTIGQAELGVKVNELRTKRLDGIEAYERTIFCLRVTRFWDKDAHYPDLTVDYAAVNTVVSWAGIKTLGALVIPETITEPKMVERDAAGDWQLVSLQWRLAEVCPQYQGKYATIQWVWDGAVEWDSALYNVP